MWALTNDVKSVLRHNQDGGRSTQGVRWQALIQTSNQIVSLDPNYKKLRLKHLQGRHINAVVDLWKEQGISEDTLRNRMSYVRWLCEKCGKSHIVSKSNEYYGIGPRQVKEENIAWELTDDLLESVKGPYPERMRVSLELQRWYGLRLEESLKNIVTQSFREMRGTDLITIGMVKSCDIDAMWADKDRKFYMYLMPTWCKGGRPRAMQVRTDKQIEIVKRMYEVARRGSMIPRLMNYVTYREKFVHWTRKAGANRHHGLRHMYGQQRYFELAGRACAKAGGLPPETREDKDKDKEARQILTQEMGHNRLRILDAYLGAWAKAKS